MDDLTVQHAVRVLGEARLGVLDRLSAYGVGHDQGERDRGGAEQDRACEDENAQERERARDLLRDIRGRHCLPQSSFTAVSACSGGRLHPNGGRASVDPRCLTSRRGPRPRLPRDLRLDADRPARPRGAAPPPRRRPAAVRLRRGDAAPADALERRALELREVFLTHYHADHYLGLPGMLKTFALRGREVPITIYGPRGAARPVRLAAPDLREAHVPVRARGARSRATCSTAATTASYVRRRARRAARSGTRSSRRRGPGRFDVQAADALGVPPGRSAGALQRGETITLADGASSRRSGCSARRGPGARS